MKTIYATILCLIVLVLSCKKDSPIPVASDFPDEVDKIISNKCATPGCHNSISYQAAANLNLSSYSDLFRGSSNGSPVIPFSPDFSSLCYFVNTYPEFGISNSPTMPLNGNPLNKQEVKTIYDWIQAGAPDKNGYIMWSENPNRSKYYVLNQGCDVVTVFDANSQLPMRYIKVGNNPNASESPHMLKLSPDGKFWYVVFVGNNVLQKYRTSDDSFVSEVSLGNFQDWNTITISNDNKRAYCVSWQTNSRIAVVDIENMRLLKNIGGFTNAHGIALNNTNDTIYMTAQTGNYIYKLDTGFNSINTVVLDLSGTPNATSSLDPHEITFSPDGLKYFVTCQQSNEVRVISTVGDNLLQVISTGIYPLEMAKSVTRNKLYVSCQNDPNSNPKVLGSVTVIDMTNYTSTNYKVGYQPHGLGVDETNNLLIVASRNLITNGPTPHHTGVCGRNGFVNFFDLNNMQLLSKKTEVSSDPYSVIIKP